MIEYLDNPTIYVEWHRAYTKKIQDNIYHLYPIDETIEIEMDREIDKDIKYITNMRITEIEKHISPLTNLLIVGETDWIEKSIKLWKEWIDNMHIRILLRGDSIDKDFINEINNKERQIKKEMNLMIYVTRAREILILLDEQIKKLYKHIPNIYKHHQNEVKDVRARVREINDRVEEIKSNALEGNIEKIGLELLELAQQEERRLEIIEKLIERAEEDRRLIPFPSYNTT